MSNVVQGDIGLQFQVVISDDEDIVNLSSADSITAHFIRGDKTTFSMSLETTSADEGIAEAIISAGDIGAPGNYVFQLTVVFSDGHSFTSDPHTFYVAPKIYVTLPG